MKLMSLLIAIFSLGSVAQASCLGEAQIIVPIKSAEIFKVGYCKVFFDPAEVKFFAPSRVCPLSLSEIVKDGVVAGFSNGWECRFEPGDQINGVIVKDSRGFLKIDGM